MVDEKIDEKETLEMKKTHNHSLGNRKDIMKITHVKVENKFSDIVSKDNFSPEQITELNISLPKIL